MRFKVIIHYMGVVLLLNAAFMLLSTVIAAINGMDSGFLPLLLSFAMTAALGIFPLFFAPSERNISSKEGYLIVVGSWLAACVMAMMPYLLWGGPFDGVNAWFESVSGLTTTGSTILEDVEALPRSLLFWRSATHWLGGIGVVMFVMLILPAMGQVRTTLSNAQLSPLAKENFRYKTQKTIQILLVVYLGLTLAQTFFLWVAGMGWFDAVNHAFSTVATGGFSTKNQSLAFYGGTGVEVVTILFMIVSGMHFGLIYATLTGRRNNLFRSELTRFYLIVLGGAGAAVSLVLWLSNVYPDLAESLRYGFFQLVSVMTGTGFATADSAMWPPFVVLTLIFFSIVGACAGSTTGGVKVDRLLLSVKSMMARVRQLQHPAAIVRVKMDGMPVNEGAVGLVNTFILFFVLILMLGTLFCTLFGLDLMTAFSVSFASMANVGPGFGEVSSMATYAHLPVPVKMAATLLMLLGRLEIFGLIQIFFYKAWK